MAGVDTTVVGFDKEPVYFAGEDNKRIVDKAITFPAEGTYESIVLHLALSCPSGGCDPWDRVGSLQIVVAEGVGDAPDTVIELSRFVTPYKVGGAWDLDLTGLRPLLKGDVTLRGFIDTWVGPGSPYGDGWLLSASFEMKGGTPARLPISVQPVWTATYVPYGDPAKPIAGVATPSTLELPAGATSFELRSFVTGHGQGNLENCAEFCSKDHAMTVGGVAHTQTIWRDDCATTGVKGQQGTWKYSRAGWCPGADVRPWTIDVTADLAGKTSAEIAYDVETYDNTCRPDATTCAGCTLGTGCEYDGGSHTEPNFQISAALISYR